MVVDSFAERKTPRALKMSYSSMLIEAGRCSAICCLSSTDSAALIIALRTLR